MADDYKETGYFNTKNTSGNARNGEYYHSQSWTSTDGTSGTLHTYPDGTKEFIANPPPIQVVSQSPQPITSAPIAAPAPVPAPAPAPPAPSVASQTNNRPVVGITDPNLGPQRPLVSVSTNDPGKGTPSPSVASQTDNRPVVGITPAPVAAPVPAPAPAPPSPSVASQTNNRPVVGITDPNLGPQRPEVSISSTDIGKGTPAVSGINQSHGTGGTAPAGGSYTIAPGDTMWGIAQAHNISLKELEQLNPQVTNPDVIHAGHTLNLPGGAPAVVPATPLTSAPLATPAAQAQAASINFPTRSSYHLPVERIETAVQHELSGWAGGTGNDAPDPAKNIIEASAKPNTDPLKIKENETPRTV